MGYPSGNHYGFSPKGALSGDACNKYTSDNSGQARFKEHVRMSCLQNQNKRTYLCVDIQLKNERQTRQMDTRWSSTTFTNLSNSVLINYALQHFRLIKKKHQNTSSLTPSRHLFLLQQSTFFTQLPSIRLHAAFN